MGDPDEKIQVQLVSMFTLKEKKKIGFLLDVLINTYSDNATLDAVLKASSAKEMYGILHKAVGERMKEEDS
jgi:hypothetical protein